MSTSPRKHLFKISTNHFVDKLYIQPCIPRSSNFCWMQDTSDQEIRCVVDECVLESLHALPAGIHFVSYEKKNGIPYPQNLWANSMYLDNLAGISFEEFLKQVRHKIQLASLNVLPQYLRISLQDLSQSANDLDKSMWEHRYHTVQVDGGPKSSFVSY